MKNASQVVVFCLLCTALGIFSCMDHDIGSDPDTPVDSVQVIAALSAPGRYWVLEKITRTVGDKTQDISEDTAFLNQGQIWYAHAIAYQFLNFPGNRTMFESPQEDVIFNFNTFEYADGLSGDRPYGIAELILRNVFIHLGPFHGKWNWDNSKQTVSVQLPTPPYQFWKVDKGYLDPKMFPKYKNLAEAQDAAKPERIRIVLEENVDAQNKVIYAYTLRAAWILSTEPGTPREVVKYRVIY